MTLTIRKSNYQEWYEQNKQRLSAKRKKLYAEDPEYRRRALEASRRKARGERIPLRPPDAQISFAEATARISVGLSTLREWRRKKLFPEPKYHNRALWFTDKQVLLLKRLLELRKYRNRSKKIKQQRTEEIKTFISNNWN